jgi:hypothetical protein
MGLNAGKPQCQATAKTTGNQCDNDAMSYADYCRMHSGRSQQMARIRRLVDPALDRIADILEHPDFESLPFKEKKDAVGTIRLVLEAAGAMEPKRSEVTVITDSVIDDEIRRLTEELEGLDVEA